MEAYGGLPRSSTSTSKSPKRDDCPCQDDKENAHLIISQTIVDTLKSLKPWECPSPKLDAQRQKELLLDAKRTCKVVRKGVPVNYFYPMDSSFICATNANLLVRAYCIGVPGGKSTTLKGS